MQSSLLQPIQVGALKLSNRVIMAPLTRCRASGEDGRTPNDLMKEYYVQRATAGLILTEATAVNPMGVGYPNTPGIWSEAHIAGWKKITDAVHAVGGKMVLQLWHVGRISHPTYLNGELPVAPSAIQPKGHVSLMRPETAFVIPRELETSEIPTIVEAYRQGAENAKKAGFDGVEIHAANGYLIDQFLQDGTNKRTDQYGGVLENRARFLLETVDAVISVWGADRVGVHLSPRGDSHDMSDSNLKTTFTYVAEKLNERQIAFIFTREYQADNSVAPAIRKIFKGIYIGNEKFNIARAEEALQAKAFDAISFGKDYISNPDLVKRIQRKAELNTLNPATIYAKGSEGYTDYPVLV